MKVWDLHAWLHLQGQVVEVGSHVELLAAGGKYAELWSRQQANVDEVYDADNDARATIKD